MPLFTQKQDRRATPQERPSSDRFALRDGWGV
jgi:hypothetical protein